MEIGSDLIKELRDETGVSVMQCKKALEEAGGDLAAAREILHTKAAGAAAKKADRELAAGAIGAYVHDGAVGAMALLSCETDFVAKNPEFAALAKELAQQICAMAPESVETLLAQPFIKDGGKTVGDLVSEASQKFGERVEVSQIARLSAR
ncbi:MAG TPA: translation elongation factor Ts [Candidatus Paceibacterota bacterium]|nr:translation elongation factor Ts [Candidatus Paceibacterota bacterium]